jgi:hypothetical protein
MQSNGKLVAEAELMVQIAKEKLRLEYLKIIKFYFNLLVKKKQMNQP